MKSRPASSPATPNGDGRLPRCRPRRHTMRPALGQRRERRRPCCRRPRARWMTSRRGPSVETLTCALSRSVPDERLVRPPALDGRASSLAGTVASTRASRDGRYCTAALRLPPGPGRARFTGCTAAGDQGCEGRGRRAAWQAACSKGQRGGWRRPGPRDDGVVRIVALATHAEPREHHLVAHGRTVRTSEPDGGHHAGAVGPDDLGRLSGLGEAVGATETSIGSRRIART